MYEFKTVRELYESCYYGNHILLDSLDEIGLEGWIRTNRNNGSIGFIELNDGTYFKNAQIVYDKNIVNNFEDITHHLTGCSISIKGKFVLTPEAKQPFEIQLHEFTLIGDCDASYPLQKKRHSFEYLRDIAHLRPRTNTFNAVFRLRSVLSMAIHEFFQDQGFVYVHTPLLTGISCEGDDMFHVVTGNNDKEYDSYFNKKTLLSGSGQIHVEAFAMAFRDVYTFGPTFRSEKSNTRTHASEFWMIEPEIAFADINDLMDIEEDFLKYIVKFVLENCPDEIDFFDKFVEKGLKEKLENVVNSTFIRIDHKEVIDLLKNSGERWEFEPSYEEDIAKEHERWLTNYFSVPVFIKNWPAGIKAYYMKLNEDGKTVAGVDLEVPGAGELIGGSQREEKLDVLLDRMKELGVEEESIEWYVNLRRYGGCIHSGFGMGFERLIMYLTGIENIRDVIPYPRTPGSCEF